jgi:hypothetical protein
MKKNIKSEGFGFSHDESGHHFLVTIPTNSKSSVVISEQMTTDNLWKDDANENLHPDSDKSIRVILSYEKWAKIEQSTLSEFNKRLKKENKKSSAWKQGMNIVNRNLGKELVLLCWAIEDAETALIPTAIQNWLGLAPEERWWLYTMTNAASGHAINGKNKGWRKAVRFALTENPVSSRTQNEQVSLFDMFLESSSLNEEATKTTKKKVSDHERNYLANTELSNDI